MPLKCFIRNKNLANILFASIILPYLILSLTVGGFHNSIFNAKNCNHAQKSVSSDVDSLQVGVLEDTSKHNPETCQICQWLKTPTALTQLLSLDTKFEYVCINTICHSNPVLASLSIQKFTIRPPPSFSCFPT